MSPFLLSLFLRLASAPNNPLSVLKCLLGTLFSKHKSSGRILLDQVSRKSVAQAGDNSPMDKDRSLGEKKEPLFSSQACPLPLPALSFPLNFRSPHS